MSNKWTYSSKLCFFKKFPQCFHWGNSAMNMGTRTTGPAVKNHISSGMVRIFIATCPTMYHLWFLDYLRVRRHLHLHQPLHNLHRKSQYRRTEKTEILKFQYQNGVEVRMESFGETRCMHPQTPKTKIPKHGESEKVQKISHELPDWLQEFRENLVDESTSTRPWGNREQGSQDTSKSSLDFPMEPRAKVEPGSGKHSVHTHLPKNPNCDICLKTKITRASCRRRAGTVVPRAEHFGDLSTADHKILSEGSESRNNHRYAVVVQGLATQWIQSYPCKTKTF